MSEVRSRPLAVAMAAKIVADIRGVTKIPLSMTWNLLSRNAKQIVISNYMEDRRRGYSIDDARYFANYNIDVLRDLKVGG